MSETTAANGSRIAMQDIFNGRRFLSIMLLCLCEFVRGAVLFYILPIYVRGMLHMAPAIVGYAIALHYVLDTALRGPSGWLIDRFGQRLVLAASLAIGWGGLWLALHAERGWLPVVAGCGLMGLGIAPVWPAVIARITGDLDASSRATAMSGVFIAWLVGVGAGTVSMGWLLGYHLKSGFAALFIVWAVAWIVSIFAMSGKAIHESSALVDKPNFSSVMQELSNLKLLFPGMFVQTFAMGLLLPVFVLYARYELHLSGEAYSYILVLGGAATVVLQLPIGRLIDRYGYKGFLVAGFGLGAIFIPIMIHLHSIIWVCGGVIGVGAAYALILPSWNSVIANAVSERQRGVMWGAFMTIEGLGMATGPFLGGQLWTWFTPATPFYAASGILIFMMLFYSFAPIEHLFGEPTSEGL